MREGGVNTFDELKKEHVYTYIDMLHETDLTCYKW